jgi:FeS assembly SUF system regulator
MLRISKLADYATMIMVRSARSPNESLTAKKIAQDMRLQQPTVSKILKLLAKAKLLNSQRGVQGGYKLSKAANEITVADIIAAIDGQIALTECNHDLSTCDLASSCSTKDSWKLINHAIYQVLSEMSLADLEPKIMKR